MELVMLSALKESVDYPSYFEIPGFSRYVINPDGVVLVKDSGKVLSGSINPDGYCHFRIVPDGMKVKTIGRHRLLAAVFKHPGTDVTGLVVNHLNGIKGDDRLENLEWATHQENIEHAGANGLTEKCKPIAVRDADTGEVRIYRSYVEYSRESGLSKDAVAWRMRCGEHRVFPERRQYRPASKKGEWYTPKEIESEIHFGRKVGCQLRDLRTGEIRFFEKVSDLAAHLGFSLAKMWALVNDSSLPVVSAHLQVRAYSTNPWREVLDPYFEIEQRFGTKPVVVWQDDEMSIFESARLCAEAKGLKVTALNYRLKSGGAKVFADGCRYAYYRDYVKTHGLNPQ